MCSTENGIAGQHQQDCRLTSSSECLQNGCCWNINGQPNCFNSSLPAPPNSSGGSPGGEIVDKTITIYIKTGLVSGISLNGQAIGDTGGLNNPDTEAFTLQSNERITSISYSKPDPGILSMSDGGNGLVNLKFTTSENTYGPYVPVDLYTHTISMTIDEGCDFLQNYLILIYDYHNGWILEDIFTNCDESLFHWETSTGTRFTSGSSILWKSNDRIQGKKFAKFFKQTFCKIVCIIFQFFEEFTPNRSADPPTLVQEKVTLSTISSFTNGICDNGYVFTI